MTTIELSDQEAKDFLLFQKYRNVFEQLEKSGAFELPEGRIEIWINYPSLLGDIVIHERFRHS